MSREFCSASLFTGQAEIVTHHSLNSPPCIRLDQLAASSKTRITASYSDESFRQDLARALEQQAEAWADEMLSISDDELPTHEAIGRARLRMQSRQWLAGKYNPQFADKPNQTQVSIGVQVVLPETDRVKLIERRDRALLAIQNKAERPKFCESLPRLSPRA